MTCTLFRAELLESRLPKGGIEKYDKFMRRTNVMPISMDSKVPALASTVRDRYIDTDFELLTPDAVHLATYMQNADEFQTFDGSDPKNKPGNPKKKRCGLLLLNGDTVNGKKFAIVKPSAKQVDLLKNAAAIPVGLAVK
ncbi:MAG TPA: hypothetical protein VER03_25695 [Bryobacteraceae bacterium]|nr:hypothetical protein [Bryobacteraceae bacterium]